MHSTFLLHKPVIYGSTIANGFFLIVLLLHIIAAVIAPIAGGLAFAARKGGRIHQKSGHYFSIAMVVVTLSGLVLDIVRLSFFIEENHTKYAGYTMPSTYPARLGFLFVGLCVLYLLRETQSPQIAKQNSSRMSIVMPILLAITGLMLTGLIVFRLNPWTGALWMIWTFMLMILLVARENVLSSHLARRIIQHRIGMSALAAFSWWGAFQGFGPAIAISILGDDPSLEAYVGNQPGSFSPVFFLFLISWAPFFILAANPFGYLKRLRS